VSVANIALIGDLHGSWDALDVAAFNRADYDLLIFTGDLGSGTLRNGVDIAKLVSGLTTPTIVMPGNNDAPFLAEIAAEFGHQRGLSAILDLGRSSASRRAQVILCGYRLHRLPLPGLVLSVVTGRPCAMGGGEFSFADEVTRAYGVSSMEESTERIVSLVDEVDTEWLLLLGHNGPRGLGGRSTDLWGADFLPEAGDWGDPDLAVAVARAEERGLRTIVVAGHMHHHTKDGKLRRWRVSRGGTEFVNPARVPRIRPGDTCELRYHVALELDATRGSTLREVDWPSD
jgi:uncharacterized protein (TIGR04168 family)